MMPTASSSINARASDQEVGGATILGSGRRRGACSLGSNSSDSSRCRAALLVLPHRIAAAGRTIRHDVAGLATLRGCDNRVHDGYADGITCHVDRRANAVEKPFDGQAEANEHLDR